MHMNKNNHNYNTLLYISWFSFENISTFPHNIDKSQFPDIDELKD